MLALYHGLPDRWQRATDVAHEGKASLPILRRMRQNVSLFFPVWLDKYVKLLVSFILNVVLNNESKLTQTL